MKDVNICVIITGKVFLSSPELWQDDWSSRLVRIASCTDQSANPTFLSAMTEQKALFAVITTTIHCLMVTWATDVSSMIQNKVPNYLLYSTHLRPDHMAMPFISRSCP